MSGSIKFLTYNVWSCESVAVYRRIKSICEIIEQHDPDVIILQEVTEYIYTIFQEAPWLEAEDALPRYNGIPDPVGYQPSRFPRAGTKPSDLHSAWVYTKRHRLRAATCRLPSPSPSSIGYEHRRAQASAFLEHFDALVLQPEYETFSVLDENIVLGGDLGWDDDLDGPLRLGNGGRWVDAWMELRGGEDGGWTYDAVANPMLRCLNLPVERKRPDRFICKLRDFRLDSIQMVGVDAIPGVTRFDDKKEIFVPVRPSYHFGLLLTISPK